MGGPRNTHSSTVFLQLGLSAPSNYPRTAGISRGDKEIHQGRPVFPKLGINAPSNYSRTAELRIYPMTDSLIDSLVYSTIDTLADAWMDSLMRPLIAWAVD